MGESERYGWWSDHDFKRRSIKHDFLTFCGWNALEDTARGIGQTPGALVCALMETGGRASEILTLKPEQFDLRENHVMVMRMKVLKHRQKEYLKFKNGKFKLDKNKNKIFKWVPKPVDRTFPIPLDDPLIDPLMDYISTIKTGDRIFPFGYSKLYKIIRDLDKPNGAKHGPWWPHRFRGERATQLVIEKGFGVIQLMKWFGWARTDTPTFYANLSPAELVKMITEGK